MGKKGENSIKSNKEIEYKWQARSIRDYKSFLQLTQKFGAKIFQSKKKRIKDVYLDTPEIFFQMSDLECRIRSMNGCFEITLKDLPDSPDPDKKVFNRFERTIPLPHFNSIKAAIDYCRQQFFMTIQPLFEILNNRQIHTVILPCGTRAEAAFDQVLMTRGEKKFRMHEIELEFKRGIFENFKAFIDKLPISSLKASISSKFQVGMSNLFNDYPSSSIDPHTVEELGKINKNIEKLGEIETLVRSELNSDAIHDMRVIIRRLSAAIKTFNKTIAMKTKKIRKKLQKLFRLLGKKRDLDIFSEFIFKSIKINTISLPEVTQQMDKAQKKITKMLNSKYYANLLGGLHRLKAATGKRDDNIIKLSRNKIQKTLNKITVLSPLIDLQVEDRILHQLRILIKKLRYTCEFFEPLFTKYICSLDPFIEKTKKLQDALGEHQDAIVGISMLHDYQSQFSKEDFEKIKNEYELKKRKTRQSFFEMWKNFWFGAGFQRSNPKTAIELILAN